MKFQLVYKCFEVACCAESTSFQSDETKVLITEVDDLYKKCKRIAKKLKANRPSRSLTSPRPSLEPPPRIIADAMADVYFQCFEPVHRILHEPSLWAEYPSLWENPNSVPAEQRLKVLLVIGIGSSLYGEAGPDSELRGQVQQWIYTAQAWLSGPLEKDRLNITGLQIQCLVMLARQIFSIGGDLVWVSMGSLIHRAMQIGLHRDPKHLPSMSILQAEIHRRLWYTILELLVQSSLDSAMPPRISVEDFDTEPPSNVSDSEIDESTEVLLPHARTTHTAPSPPDSPAAKRVTRRTSISRRALTDARNHKRLPGMQQVCSRQSGFRCDSIPPKLLRLSVAPVLGTPTLPLR